MNPKVKKLTYGGLMIALVYIATYSIRIPIPFTQGYIHPGDSMIFVSALIFGWKMGALAGGIGSALADILGGYANWAIPTFVIKGIMGALVGLVSHDLKKVAGRKIFIILGFLISLFWVGFNFFLKNTLVGISNNSTELIGEVDGVTTIEELLLLSQKVQGQLLWIGIIFSILIIILSYYFSRGRELFKPAYLLAMIIAGLWMVIGYYLAAGVMYGSFIVPIFSIPWNVIQFIAGFIIAYLIIIPLQKIPFR